MSRKKHKTPLSIGKSIVVWVGGAVLGWVVAVVFIYGALRFTTEERVADNVNGANETGIAQDDARELQEIAPAAGASQPGSSEDDTNAQDADGSSEEGENQTPPAGE